MFFRPGHLHRAGSTPPTGDVIRFVEPASYEGEPGDTIEVLVERVGSGIGAASASITLGGDAVEGVDYTVSGSASWSSGEVGVKAVTVELLAIQEPAPMLRYVITDARDREDIFVGQTGVVEVIAGAFALPAVYGQDSVSPQENVEVHADASGFFQLLGTIVGLLPAGLGGVGDRSFTVQFSVESGDVSITGNDTTHYTYSS